MRRSKVRPLAQVRLAENARAGGPEAADDEGVFGGDRAFERERRGGGRHAIRRVDVVFDENRNAVKRPAQAPGLALGVERIGNGEGVRVELDDRLERWAV